MSIDQGLQSPPRSQQDQSEPATAEHYDSMQARSEVAEHESAPSASSPTGSGCATWFTPKGDPGRSAIGTHSSTPE